MARMSKRKKLEKDIQDWVDLAGRLSGGSQSMARLFKIEERERVYHLVWPKPISSEVEWITDLMPQVVCDRAISKLTDQPYMIYCRSVAPEVMPPSPDVLLEPNTDPQAIEAVQLEEARKLAKKASEEKASVIRGIIQRIEAQKGFSVREALNRNATVTGYAGPLRVGYDPSAEIEPGCVPLFITTLDPRCYYEIPDDGAGNGPRVVVYKREATREALESEGWQLPEGDQDGPDERITIYDLWRKVRNEDKLEVWHAILLDGGGAERKYLKEPTDMYKARGISRIPYVFRKVRPTPYAHELYLGGEATAFIDVLIHNFEQRCRLLSRLAQHVALSVDPPVLKKVREDIEVDLTTPGSEMQVNPDEDVMLLVPQISEPLAQAWGMVEQMTQRGTFAAASYGEGVRAMSGIMTSKLQQAGEEALDGVRTAVEAALGDLCGIIAQMAAVYMGEGGYVLPHSSEYGQIMRPGLFRPSDVFEVAITPLSLAEVVQLLAGMKVLSDPRADGSKWVSDTTTRELTRVLANPNVEEERIRAELAYSTEFQNLLKQSQRDAARIEQIEDMLAQFGAQMQIQSMMAGAMPPPGPGGAPPGPGSGMDSAPGMNPAGAPGAPGTPMQARGRQADLRGAPPQGGPYGG